MDSDSDIQTALGDAIQRVWDEASSQGLAWSTVPSTEDLPALVVFFVSAHAKDVQHPLLKLLPRQNDPACQAEHQKGEGMLLLAARQSADEESNWVNPKQLASMHAF